MKAIKADIGWLSRHDSQPSPIPRWPSSQRLCLVCAEDMEFEGMDCRATQLDSPVEADDIMYRSPSIRKLFFVVSKAALAQIAVS